MSTKVQPTFFTFEIPSRTKQHPTKPPIKPPVKKYPAVEIDPVKLCNQLCLYRSKYKGQIESIAVFLSSSNTCTPSKALPFFTQQQLKNVGYLFLCVLGKKAVSESAHPFLYANHAINLLLKNDWNSSDRCVFESARIECLQMMRSISSKSFAREDQNRIIMQMKRTLPSRSIAHLTENPLTMKNIPIMLLGSFLRFVGPRSFVTVIPKVSKQWKEACALPMVSEIQTEHCKKEVEQIAALKKNLKEAAVLITAEKMQDMFATSPLHEYQHRFEQLLRDQVPIVGKLYPGFYETLKRELSGFQNVAGIDPIIWKVVADDKMAKSALIQGAADAFEERMLASIKSLLPKNEG